MNLINNLIWNIVNSFCYAICNTLYYTVHYTIFANLIISKNRKNLFCTDAILIGFKVVNNGTMISLQFMAVAYLLIYNKI